MGDLVEITGILVGEPGWLECAATEDGARLAAMVSYLTLLFEETDPEHDTGFWVGEDDDPPPWVWKDRLARSELVLRAESAEVLALMLQALLDTSETYAAGILGELTSPPVVVDWSRWTFPTEPDAREAGDSPASAGEFYVRWPWPLLDGQPWRPGRTALEVRWFRHYSDGEE